MSTSCCQISTPYRLVVSEYEVPKVFVCKSDAFFLVHPVFSSWVSQTPGRLGNSDGAAWCSD